MRFTDKKLYVTGIGTATMTDPATGNVLYWTDKCREGDVSLSTANAVLNAGLHNAPVMILPTSPDISVRVSAADYSEWARAASAGASILQGAPILTCQTVEALGTSLTVNVAGATPVAGLGMDKPLCYVQEIGSASLLWADGSAYDIDPATGNVVGFTAEPGKQYFVSFWAVQANAALTVFSVPFRRKIVRFVLTRAIYTSYDPQTGAGDFYGWLHEIIPYLQLMAAGASTNGSQTDFTMTDITGRALTCETKTVKANCGSCDGDYPAMLYRIVQPCDSLGKASGVNAILGGKLEISVGESAQLHPAVIRNGILSYGVPPSEFSYSSSDPSVVTVSNSSGMVIGVGAGDARIAVFYTIPETGETLTDIALVSVKGEAGTGTVVYIYASAGTTVTLCFEQSSADCTVVSWGDGSDAETSSDLSAKMTHLYAESGTYSVTLTSAYGTTWSAGITENGERLNFAGKTADGTLDTSIRSVSFGAGARLNGIGGFSQCQGLTGISFDESDMTDIGQESFYGCQSLGVISFGSITSIGQGAFESCLGLIGVAIPSSVTLVKANAFKNTGLENITLAAARIEGDAFAYCANLRDVWILSTVTNIGNDAGVESDYPWNGCTAATILYCEASNKPNGWGYEYNVYGFSGGARTRLITVWGQDESPFEPYYSEEMYGNLAYTWDVQLLKIDLIDLFVNDTQESVEMLGEKYYKTSDVVKTVEVTDT